MRRWKRWGMQMYLLMRWVTGESRSFSLRRQEVAKNLARNTHTIHKTALKPRYFRIGRLNGIQEVRGSIPLRSTK